MSLRIGSLVAVLLASSAIAGSMAMPQRREHYKAPQADRVRAQRAEQEASELLSRNKPKRHQPKRKAQRPNRAQRRGK